MIQMKLAKGDVCVIGEKQYEFTRRYLGDRIELEHIDTGERMSITDLELAERFSDGSANFYQGAMRHRKNFMVKRRDFGSLDEKIKEEPRRKHHFLKRLAQMGITIYNRSVVTPALVVIAKELGDKKPPSYSAVCKWRKKAGQSMDIRNLVDQRHFKEGQLQLDSQVREVIGRKISEHYMTPERPSIQDTYDAICNEIDEINLTRDDDSWLAKPSYHAVWEAVHRVDEYSIVASRYSKADAEARFAPVSLGPNATYPLSAAELDHTKLDLMVVNSKNNLTIGRPWIVFLVDRRTRMPLGFHVSFDPPSVQTVAQCLKNAFLPKSYVKKVYTDIRNDWPCYGVPKWIVFDRAMENVGKDIEEMAACLGFHVEFCPRKKAWYKGRIERFMGTLNKRILHKIPGTTFSNTAERGEYNSTKNAIIALDELLHLLHKWLVDDYAQTPHRGLKDIPAKVWEREISSHPILPPPNLADLNAKLGRVEERVLTRKGIEFENLFYSRDDVIAWRSDSKFKKLTDKTQTGQKVKIKYDPTDMSKIWVLDPRNHQYVEVPCKDQKYTKGISIWEHRSIKTHLRDKLKKEVDMCGLQQARAEIEAEVSEYLGRRKGKRRNSTSAYAARMAGLGRIAPAGDSSPLNSVIATALPHTYRSKGNKGTAATKKTHKTPKPSSEGLPPAMPGDSIDLYDSEF